MTNTVLLHERGEQTPSNQLKEKIDGLFVNNADLVTTSSSNTFSKYDSSRLLLDDGSGMTSVTVSRNDRDAQPLRTDSDSDLGDYEISGNSNLIGKIEIINGIKYVITKEGII